MVWITLAAVPEMVLHASSTDFGPTILSASNPLLVNHLSDYVARLDSFLLLADWTGFLA